MLTDTQLQTLHSFPTAMLEALNFAQIDHDKIASQYGYVWDDIKDLPQYKSQSLQVADALKSEGRLTPFIAANALFEATEKISERVLDPKIPTADLIRAAETLMKIKNDGKPQQSTISTGTNNTFIINLPALNGSEAKTLEFHPAVKTIDNPPQSTFILNTPTNSDDDTHLYEFDY